VSKDLEFRTPEQEVVRLLEECAELKRALKTISAQVGRMESRVKRAFPDVAAQVRERRTTVLGSKTPTLTSQTALAEFDRVVGLVAAGSTQEAERVLEVKSAADLFVMAKELGVSFPKSKPSIRAMREAIFGKVRESILLSRHNPRA
jgi:hypothetical protein